MIATKPARSGARDISSRWVCSAFAISATPTVTAAATMSTPTQTTAPEITRLIQPGSAAVTEEVRPAPVIEPTPKVTSVKTPVVAMTRPRPTEGSSIQIAIPTARPA